MSDTELLPKSNLEPVRRLEVFTGSGRRRAWTADLIAESYENGETVSAQSTLLLSLAGGESAQTAVWMLRDVAARPGLCFAISWRDDEDKHVRTDVGLFQ